MRLPHSFVLPVVLAAPALGAPQLGGPHVVGPSGFASVQDAVDAASDGDLVLVQSGTWESAVIDGKGLVIAADAGAAPVLLLSDFDAENTDHVRISNLAASQSVSLIGLDIVSGPFLGDVPALWVEGCAGPVLLEDCTLRTVPSSPIIPAFAPSALRVVDCAAVSVVGSTLDAGGIFAGIGFAPSAGLDATDSEVFLYRTLVLGGQGASGDPLSGPPGGPGAPGVSQRGGRVVAVDCSLTGGSGGDGLTFFGGNCGDGGPGGPAIRLEAGAGDPELVLVDTEVHPGAGGTAVGDCVPGQEGVPSVVLAGAIVTSDVVPRGIEADAVVPRGSTLTATITGEPQDFVLLVFSFVPANPVWLPEFTGAAYAGQPFFVLNLGVLNASGRSVLTHTNEGQGVPWLPHYFQTLHVTPDLEIVVSNPRLALLLDD